MAGSLDVRWRGSSDWTNPREATVDVHGVLSLTLEAGTYDLRLGFSQAGLGVVEIMGLEVSVHSSAPRRVELPRVE